MSLSKAQQIGGALDLHTVSRSEARGSVEGCELIVTGASPQRSGRFGVRVPLLVQVQAHGVVKYPRATPEYGRSLGHGLDHLLVGCSDPDQLLAQLLRPDVYQALTHLHPACVELTLEDVSLSMLFSSKGDVEADVDAVVWIARLGLALRADQLEPWALFAQARGLRCDRVACLLEGVVGDTRVRVRYDADRDCTEVVGMLARPLPPGTRVGHPAKMPDGAEVDDPILGGRVSVRAQDALAVESRLARDEVRGPLLELIHDYRGSTVIDGEIRLLESGLTLHGLNRRLQLVADLDVALAAP